MGKIFNWDDYDPPEGVSDGFATAVDCEPGVKYEGRVAFAKMQDGDRMWVKLVAPHPEDDKEYVQSQNLSFNQGNQYAYISRRQLGELWGGRPDGVDLDDIAGMLVGVEVTWTSKRKGQYINVDKWKVTKTVLDMKAEKAAGPDFEATPAPAPAPAEAPAQPVPAAAAPAAEGGDLGGAPF